jgi:hypothetical protein
MECESGQREEKAMFEGSTQFDEMHTELEDLMENQSINVDDMPTDQFVLLDGERVEGAEVNWDCVGVTVAVPDEDERAYDWSEVVSVEEDEDGDVVISFDDGTSVAIAARVIA